MTIPPMTPIMSPVKQADHRVHSFCTEINASLTCVLGYIEGYRPRCSGVLALPHSPVPTHPTTMDSVWE